MTKQRLLGKIKTTGPNGINQSGLHFALTTMANSRMLKLQDSFGWRSYSFCNFSSFVAILSILAELRLHVILHKIEFLGTLIGLGAWYIMYEIMRVYLTRH